MTDQKQSRVHLRGFASMSPEKRKAIAAKGGKAVPAELRSYSQSKALAISAGRKGGLAGGAHAAKAKAKRDAKSGGVE